MKSSLPHARMQQLALAMQLVERWKADGARAPAADLLTAHPDLHEFLAPPVGLVPDYNARVRIEACP